MANRAKQAAAKRDAVRARSATARGMPSRAPIDVLKEAIISVGDAFGETPDCASAAAMMQATGRHLGYEFHPRPVSVVAYDEATKSTMFMGPKATSRIPESERSRVEDHLPNGKDNGHLVLTSEDPRLMVDANLRQLGSYGIQAPSLVLNIKSTRPEDGEWAAQIGDLSILYLVDEENKVLLEEYDKLLAGFDHDAKYLADALRAGATAEQMRSLLIRR